MLRALASGVSVALLCVLGTAAAPGSRTVGVNVVLRDAVTPDALKTLANYGLVRDVIPQINAVTMKAAESHVAAIAALPFVEAAGPDQRREAIPIAGDVAVVDFAAGLSTWNLDAINVTDLGFDNRVVPEDGDGVYVAVLDSGLLKTWRSYFPEERIAVQYGVSFGGGGGEMGTVSTQPNKWQLDQNSHGTHVTSTILGYALGANPINGVAPRATIIPVKVLNQNGSGWSSVVARGITYVADLSDALDGPVVINMSLSGPVLDAVEKAAIDYAIAKGVIIVASAGNRGDAGMGYPAAYEPVISVAASGWTGEWAASTWWYANDVTEPTDPADFYITDFSSRQKAGQDLDVAAPGSWVVGPYQTNGQLSYFFLGGTSMASPHVAGIVALMLQKNPTLTAEAAEAILEAVAIPLPAGCRVVQGPSGARSEVCWDTDATGAGLITADAALAGVSE